MDFKACTDASFDDVARDIEKQIIVMFHASWCQPCKAIKDDFLHMCSTRQSTKNVVMVDIDEAPDAARVYGIKSVPTFMLFDRGQMVAEYTGAAEKTALLAWLDTVVDDFLR